jgi:hypothetical protein
MLLRSTLLASSMLLFACCGIATCQIKRSSRIDPDEPASFQFIVVDGFGKQVSGRVASFVGMRNNRELAPQFSGLKIDKTETFQLYSYRLIPGGPATPKGTYLPITGKVDFRGRGQVLTVTAERNVMLDYRTPPPRYYTAKVLPRPRGRLVWYRLFPCFDSEIAEEGLVEASGEFFFRKLHHGKFIIAVFSDSEVVHLQTVEFGPGGWKELTIRIDKP